MPDVPDWITPITDALILVPLIVLMVRVTGLRSFAKMSAHDFVVTVGIGSTLAATVLNHGIPWWQGALAIAAILGVQWMIGALRSEVPESQRVTDNEPLVLLRDGVMDRDALRTARVTPDDLRQRLRQGGVAKLSDVAVVVLETTGDVSILTDEPEPVMLTEVRGAAGPPERDTGRGASG
ncbi:MAG: DUF421 domain-containing protein [Hasllibacter sp.]